MRIALVHEFLNQLGGAERVLQNFLEIWPNATIHVILDNEKKINSAFEKIKKHVSFLDKFPLAKSHPRLLLPFMPQAIESFDFEDFDLVISDSSSFAKGIKTDKLHICYCHTPTRYLWTDKDYLSQQNYPVIFKLLAWPVLAWLRHWDHKAGQRPNFFIANSENVRQRIKKYYNRDSVVIPPPVDTDFFHPVSAKQDYFFTASRLEPYKKIELVVEAFNDLGLKLKVAGSGTASESLKKLAKPNIEFLGRISDEELRKHYSEAQAFIFPAEEDAGIMPVEAMACSTPVIAYGKGGALETVREKVTGAFFYEQTAEAIKQAVKHCHTVVYDSEAIRGHALQYGKKIFQKKIKDFVDQKYKQNQNQDSDFISFLRMLEPEDWNTKVTAKWTVKDVVAHMVGWEKDDPEIIRKAWETKTAPWYKNTDNYDEFNAKAVEYYRNYTPEQLLNEWEQWQTKVQEEIERIGEENLKKYPDLFDWLFEGIADNRRDGTESHYKHHYEQIKRALSRVS